MTGLRVDSARWQVDGRLILDGVDITVPRGSVGGLLGPNGSGKSSLLRMITGVTSSATGDVSWFGADLLGMRARDRARRVALVEQESVADVDLTVRDVVLLGRTPHRTRWSPDSDRDLTIVDRALAGVGLADLAERQFPTLSGGERQRVHLARALAQEPELILLDEPTNHLDVHAQLAALELVRHAVDHGTTALVALHDLNLAAAYCDHVVLLAEGRVVTAGEVREVLVPEIIDPVYRVETTVLHHPSTGRPVLTFAPESTTSPPSTVEPTSTAEPASRARRAEARTDSALAHAR